MSPRGPVFLDVAGLELSPTDRDRLNHPCVGGVVLFARNYATPTQLQALVAQIKSRRDPALWVTVDQEGGRVQRFRDGLTPLPAASQIAAAYGADAEAAVQSAATLGWLMAGELRALGVDISLAPVLDLDDGTTPHNPVIGTRAFHRDPMRVVSLAEAYIRGMKAGGMPAIGKHFPGHGGVSTDSHQACPSDDRTWRDLAARDLVPFQRLIERGRLDGVMAAHIVYPHVAEQPAGFSSQWLEAVLRGRLGFQGVIFSDDLNMAGAAGAGDLPRRGRAALDAGCDTILSANDPTGTDALLESLEARPVSAISQSRLAGLSTGPAPWPWDERTQDPLWQAAHDLAVRLQAGPGDPRSPEGYTDR